MFIPYKLNFLFFCHLDSMALFICLCVFCRIYHPFQCVSVAPASFRFLLAFQSSLISLVICVSVLNSVEYCSWVWFPGNCGRCSHERNSSLQLRTPRSCNPGLWDREGAQSHEHPLFSIINAIRYILLINSQKNSQWVILEFIQDKRFGMVSCSNYILKFAWNVVGVSAPVSSNKSIVQIMLTSVVFSTSTTLS